MSFFTPRMKNVIAFSRAEAMRLRNDYIGTEHLLLGIICEGQGTAIKLLKDSGVDLTGLRKDIEDSIKVGDEIKKSPSVLSLVKKAERVLKITYLEAKLLNSDTIGTEHLLLCILKDGEDCEVSVKFLLKYNVDYESIKRKLELLSLKK